MRRLVLFINNLRGVSVIRYKEKKPKPRRKAFRGPGSYKITEETSYQKSPARIARNKRGFNRLTKHGPNDSGPFKAVKDEPDWKSAPPGAPGGGSVGGGLEEVEEQTLSLIEDILINVGGDTLDDLMAFDVQPDLNQKIWDGSERVRPGVKAALLDIVEEFMEGLDLDIDMKDLVITGSIANYNWSKFSDIDLHIIVDFADVNENEEMVKRFFDAVRSNWNKLHDINVKGHEVEIYVQGAHEPHVSTGVYSLLDNEWLVKPQKIRPAIDRGTARKKMIQMAREVDKLSAVYDRRRYQEAFDMAQRIKDKIKKMRQRGLERSGIYAPENLAFKMLRRSGDIEQLFSIYTQAYDHLYSLDQ